MPKFNHFKASTLADMLTDFTNHLTRLQSDTNSQEEYDKYKDIIQCLQTEIKLRKESVIAPNTDTGFIGLDKLMINLNANAKNNKRIP